MVGFSHIVFIIQSLYGPISKMVWLHTQALQYGWKLKHDDVVYIRHICIYIYICMYLLFIYSFIYLIKHIRLFQYSACTHTLPIRGTRAHMQV